LDWHLEGNTVARIAITGCGLLAVIIALAFDSLCDAKSLHAFVQREPNIQGAAVQVRLHDWAFFTRDELAKMRIVHGQNIYGPPVVAHVGRLVRLEFYEVRKAFLPLHHVLKGSFIYSACVQPNNKDRIPAMLIKVQASQTVFATGKQERRIHYIDTN
jgi:hypothetical protein